MKKSIFLAAVAALVLAGCAKNETFVNVANQDEVNFGAYSGRTITKAGPTDDMNLDALKQHGFGVFATYTGTDAFEDAANDKGAKDDFMFNQQVTFDDVENVWTYSPIKYWPNPTNGQDADAQKVSFFAYAPYAEPTGAANEIGITGFSQEIANDDPNDATSPEHLHNFVNYTFSKDKPNVDLMWGYKSKNSVDPATVTYTINNNLTRTTDKVRFVFQHMFAKLGGSQDGAGASSADPYTDPAYVANGLVVKANPVSLDPTNGFVTDNGTKITISKIVIASAPEQEDADGDGILED
ncbi:MAG: fimbrillin family protein, partial [Bacteroidales bacterium]|nr:fimbrillin family protein [Bacteroidales bacterium]